VWYLFRKKITQSIGGWKGIKITVEENKTSLVKEAIQGKSKLLYWLWTYGDLDDPLGTGGLPERYGKPTFWKRWKYSAIRNARFNWYYMELRTRPIVERVEVKDNLDWTVLHHSDGIGDRPDGIYFSWFRDQGDKWYFIYENNNNKAIWYFGWVGLLTNPIGKNGRFEISYRKTQSSKINN